MSKLGRRSEMDPLVSFAFKVDIDGQEVARFSGVDGLSYEAEMIEYRSSDMPNEVRFRQGRRKAGRVTLKRGVLVGGAGKDNIFFRWIDNINVGTVVAKDITITVGDYGIDKGIDETEGGKRAWTLSQCRPTKWSLSSLEGTSNNPLIESIEFAVEAVMQR